MVELFAPLAWLHHLCASRLTTALLKCVVYALASYVVRVCYFEAGGGIGFLGVPCRFRLASLSNVETKPISPWTARHRKHGEVRIVGLEGTVQHVAGFDVHVGVWHSAVARWTHEPNLRVALT